jgi:chromosome partitioning protein
VAILRVDLMAAGEYDLLALCPGGHMLVVSVLARKGGTGKSTAVRCLAVEALKAGRRVVVIDADPQPTCHRWGQRRAASGIAVPLVVVPGPGGLTAQVEGFRGQGVDLILVDTPPTATPAVNAALDASTAAIIVTRPNPEDLESVQESLRVAGAQSRRCGVILWQAPPDKRVKAVALAREALEAMGAAVCPTAVSASIAYPYAYAEGLTPQERDPEGRARAELADVWAWLQRERIVATASYDRMATTPHGRGASIGGGHPAILPDGPGTLVPFDQPATSSQSQAAKLPVGHRTAVSDGSEAKRPKGAVTRRRSVRP